MTEPPVEPDWELVLVDPEEFFGLADDYTRRDLKRSYVKWIKRFKPETHPEEFKRIRAAYEELDQELRYFGENTAGRASFFARASVEFESDDSAASDIEAAGLPAGPNTSERLASGVSPEILYRDLCGVPVPTASQHLELALLSDFAGEETEVGFLRHLLDGVKRYPQDNALWNLLVNYLHAPVFEAPLEPTLRCLAESGCTRFYYLSESLWHSLLERIPFARFRALVDEIEAARSTTLEFDMRLVFTLRITTAAFFRADDEWVRNNYELLEENYALLSDDLQTEVDFLELLMEYREERMMFLAEKDAIRQTLDDLFRARCELREFESDFRFVTEQLRTIANPKLLLAAFEPIDEEFQSVYDLVAWIADEVETRTNPNEQEVSTERMPARLEQFMLQLEKRSNASFEGICFLLAFFVGVILKWTVWVLPVLVGLVFWPDHGIPVIAVQLAWAVGAWAYGSPRWEEWLRDANVQWFARRSYRRLWRRLFLRFLTETRYPLDEVLGQMREMECSEVSNHDLLASCAYQDLGLLLYCTALRFGN